MTTSLAIRTQGLSKAFGQHTVVRDLELKVPEGSIYGFLGRNGAGKTTSMRILLGLISATSGSVDLLSTNVITNATEHRQNRLHVASKVGCLIEGPAFYPFLSGRKNLTLFAKLNGIHDKARVEHMLDRVGLLGRDHDLFGVYSRGMKQRLGIAATLISDPKLIMLDEPMNGLDPAGVVLVRNLLKEQSDRGATIFLSSHLLNDAEQFCTDIGILHEGRMVAQGPLEELCKSDLAQLELHTSNPIDASEFLEKLDFVSTVTKADSDKAPLTITLKRGAESSLNKSLVEAGYDVSALIPKRRSLENLFLDHIQNDTPPTVSQ